MSGYHFSNDWFSHSIPVWNRILSELKGKPNLKFLEIGCFEGRSVTWLLDNVITHPTSSITACDHFLINGIYDTFLSNVEKSNSLGKVIIEKEFSRKAVKNLPSNTFDFIYIDGRHESRHVLVDAVQSWECLKVGGILAFDDCEYYHPPGTDETLSCIPAINEFLRLMKDELVILENKVQVLVKKREVLDVTPYEEFCSPFGNPWGSLYYFWRDKKLRTNSGELVPFDEKLAPMLEEYLKFRTKKDLSGYKSTDFLDFLASFDIPLDSH